MPNFPYIACAIFVFLPILPGSLRGQDAVWGPASGSRPSYSVIYTGRLSGYFRYPDEQSSNQSGCPAFAEPLASPQVRRMLTTVERLPPAGSPHVFVSMGDNFAPELLARAMRDEDRDSPHFGQMLMKDLFNLGSSGEHWEPVSAGGSPRSPDALNRGRVPSDNVACFLRLAGIGAVVPGEEDFSLGPDRLRELARFLAEAPDSVYKPVQMLAANLSIVSSVHHPGTPVPSSALAASVRDALKTRTGVAIDLPVAVMPWLRTASVTTPDEAPSVFDCRANPESPRDFKLPFESDNQCTQLSRAAEGKNTYTLEQPTARSVNFLAYYTLDPGTNHALCVAYRDGARLNVFCKPFSVQSPFLQYRPDTPGTTPAPYYLSRPPAGAADARIAIFGVMDPDLIGYIGQFHYTYMNRDRRFDTKLQITDPVEALRQVVALCDADPACHGARKILLAQMPLNKALQLAAATEDFDLILAQADYEHATGTENDSRLLSGHSHPHVLAPGFSFDPSRENALSLNLRKADLYFERNRETGETREYLANGVYDPAVPPVARIERGVQALDTAAAKTVAGSATRPAAKNYEELALLAMQRFCGSDIALFQHRDVFAEFQKAIAYWPADRNYGVQQLLDEALWKGDFAFCLPVKGSTLKKMLKDSAQFDRQDRDSLSLETEKGRGLSTLGIVTAETGSDQPVIRGQPVDDNKLYGVAMTDYLAFGDTGYPELSSEAVLPRVRITSVGTLHRLTGLACEHLSGIPPEACTDRNEIYSPNYFDPIAQMPFDTSAGLSVARQFRQWMTAPFEAHPGATTLFAPQGATPESQVEHRGTWWFNLLNLDAEYDLAFLRGSDQTIPANFSGINTFSQLSTPESSKIGLWTRVRGGYLFPRFVDFYASGEEKFTRSTVRVPDLSGNGNFGPYQSTLADNLIRAEAGMLSKPVSKRVPLRALVSENLLTQVTDPFLDLFEVPPCGSPGCTPQATIFQVQNLARNYLAMSRVGIRLQDQNNDNWFEAGREYGENIGIPIGYSLQDAGRPRPYSCALAGNLSLSQCIYSDPLFTVRSRVLPNLQNQPIAGWFMDFHDSVPLYPSKLQLTIDSYGEVFDRRTDDTTFNTRYYEDLILALKVPIWGNLTFAPRVEVFFFQNKVIPGEALLTNHYTFVTSSLKLEYSFDWRRGVGIRRALRYPGGTPAGPATPLP